MREKKGNPSVAILVALKHARSRSCSFRRDRILCLLIVLVIFTSCLFVYLVTLLVFLKLHPESDHRNEDYHFDPRIPNMRESPYHELLLTRSYDKIQLPPNSCETDVKCNSWRIQYTKKLLCLYRSCGAVFVYHIRKAAGTTIRKVLSYYSLMNKWPVLESEGLTLDHRFLDQPGIISIVSFRDPVDRIISLYWYEHVLYFSKDDGNETKASSLHTWIDHWKDSSTWKKNFTKYHPGSVYIEVENYYVKALTRWDGTRPVNRQDLEVAKRVIEKFDLVIISEWFNVSSRKVTLDALVSGTETSPFTAALHLLSGNKTMINRLHNVLAPDEVSALKYIDFSND